MSKSLVFVLSSVFLLVLGTFISGTILTPYAQGIGANWIQIGVLSGCMYGVRLFIGTPVGTLADRKGYLTVLKYSLALYPFIAAAYWLSANIYFLMGARLLHGVASAMMLPICMAYVGQASPAGMEGRYMALYNFAVLLASGIGPFISVVVSDFYGDYRPTFIVLFLLSLIALGILLFIPGQETKEKNRKKEPAGIRSDPTAGKLFKSKALMALGFANIAMAVVASLVGFFIVPYFKSKAVNLVLIGSIVAVYNIVSGVVQLPLGRIMDKYNKFIILILSGILTSAALMAIPFIHSLLMIGTATAIAAVGSAAMMSAASALSILVGRKMGMGGTMGFLSTFNSMGMIFGCLALSLMPQIGFNFSTFFYLSGIIVIVNLILFSILWLGERNVTFAGKLFQEE